MSVAWDDENEMAHCLGCGRVWDGNAQCPCWLDDLDQFVQVPSVTDQLVHQLETGGVRLDKLYNWFWREECMIHMIIEASGPKMGCILSEESLWAMDDCRNGQEMLFPFLYRKELRLEPLPWPQMFRLDLLAKRRPKWLLVYLIDAYESYLKLSEPLSRFFTQITGQSPLSVFDRIKEEDIQGSYRSLDADQTSELRQEFQVAQGFFEERIEWLLG